jgi:aspartyl-tRNA(Asn)/glutamyl-tRNA(Gln) amidotransferase subunit A
MSTPRITRSVMAAMTPGADPAVLDGAAELLAPLGEALRRVDLAELNDYPPAATFTARAGPTLLARRPLPPPAPEPVPGAPAPDDLPYTPVAQLAALVRAGVLNVPDIISTYRATIDRLNPAVNAFIRVTLNGAGAALTRPGRLAGVPIGLKDVIDTAGVPTTCGSRLLADRVPARDAQVWRRLRDEGAILAGKLNTQEFAAGVTSDNDTYGAVRNPWDIGRIPGGSSGGSAAAVACGMVGAALGTDTGGSVRIPAGCCGVVGLKPTYGLVPMDGVYPLSWSLDHVGMLTRTVRDAALLLDVLAGTRCEVAARAGVAADLAGLRIGVPRSWLGRLQPAVDRCFTAALAELELRGASVLEVTLPDVDLLVAINRVIAYAEGSAAHEHLLRSRGGHGAAVRARLEAGRYLLAGDYLTAQRLRSVACQAFARVWQREAHLLAVPTLPCTAAPLGARHVDLPGGREPLATAMVRFTGPFNLIGSPAITIPCGHDSDGLPVGLHLAAAPYEEELLCFAAAAYESVGAERARRPTLTAAPPARRG